jgi:predicted permease
LRRDFALPLTALLIVVALVLLIACANIANVLMARAAARRHEWSVRLAIGASRWRIAGQILAESLMIAAAGGLLGLLVARIGASVLAGQLVNKRSGVYLDLSIDWRVFAFTAAVTLVTAVLFGLGPALSATRVAPNDALKEQGRTVAGDRRFGVRNALVVVQVALSLVLVVAAVLFVRTFVSLASAPLGFTPDRLALVNVALTQTPPEDRAGLVERLTAAAAGVPGVRSAGASLITPLSGAGWNTRLEVPAEPEGSTGQRPPWVNAVTPGWFSTYGLRVVAGRDFASTDRSNTPSVAIVNEAFVRRFYGGQNPIGQHVRAHLSQPTATNDVEVVGVVSDSVYRSVREGFVATIFVPYAQAEPWEQVGIAVSSADGPAGVRRALSGALTHEDPRITFAFADFPLAIRNTLTQEALVAQLSGLFGALALLLAGLGLYGVTAYSVNRRRSEIGVRMALGADARAIVRLVVGRVGVLIACGIAAGALLSLWGARYVAASLLFNLPARDPATVVGSAIVLTFVGCTAGWLPARRASRIDPTQTLRES